MYPPANTSVCAHASEGGKTDETLPIHLCDDNTNFIDMGCQHDLDTVSTTMPFPRDQVTQGIHLQLISILLDLRPHDGTDLGFVTRWTMGFDQLFNQRFHTSSYIFLNAILAWNRNITGSLFSLISRPPGPLR